LKDIVLSIQNLTKHYGSIVAVDRLDLDIEKGSVFGILGPNGSGKTTTLGVVLDITKPSGGSFSWFGKTASKEDRKKIGAILEVPIFYPYLSAYLNLQLIADIKGIGYGDINRVLGLVNLTDRMHSKYRTYSLGMKQRLAIAAALQGTPEVLILDEPTNGLDPQGIAEIRNLILKIAAQGITIILASHILDEVQKTCTHVAVLEKGKKLYAGKVSEVLNESHWVEIASENMAGLQLALKNIEQVKELQEEAELLVIRLAERYSLTDLNSTLISKGIVVSHLASRKKSLENYFLELLGKS
jgi:ABC-type multidrug transport system ATPase subunit